MPGTGGGGTGGGGTPAPGDVPIPMDIDENAVPTSAPPGYQPNKKSIPSRAAAEATDPIKQEVDENGNITVPYTPSKPAVTEVIGQPGWYYGIAVAEDEFATVAGMCTRWSDAEKILINNARKLLKDQEAAWAKKNACTPKKRVCVTPYSYSRKSSCGCG